MRSLIHMITQNMKRSRHYFTVLQDEVMRDNFFILMKTSVAVEVVLIAYCVFAVFAFQNRMLNVFYCIIIALNTGLIGCLRYKKNKDRLTYRFVQNACRYFLLQIFAFIIAVSVFPFPDRPAIFYSPVYLLLLILFQFPCYETFLFSTIVNAIYMVLTICVKDIHGSVYDVTAAITSWLLGLIVVALLGSLRLRSGEARILLEKSSRTDFLTGLANRREMDRQFSKIYEMCKTKGVSVATFMLDVDYFKRYNDHFGHEAGDLCLAFVGKTLQAYSEETGFYVARYGGEEFVVLLPGCNKNEAEGQAQILLEQLKFINPEGDVETFSLGIAYEVPDMKSSYYDLIQRADQALYRAKEAGRNCYMIEE